MPQQLFPPSIVCATLQLLFISVGIGSSVSAAEATTESVLAGHSYHGEAFNEGPRQFAYRMTGTGPISFEVSSLHPEVRAYIEQGIGQLHGFWYYEAERTFRHAATLDPECAIAYWGMALANTNNEDRAKKFLKEAIRFKEKASARERQLVEALELWLLSDAEKKVRAARYVQALENMVAQHPDDLEIQAFLGHALYDHRNDLKKKHEEVDAFLGKILERQPLHPVHHYRIHLWDDKDPARALESSAKCGESSPAIAHMWHMPGHIYSRLKRYQEAVWQQEASARVDHAQMMRDQVMPDQIHNFAHNNEWLIRNLIFIGRFQDAMDLAINMIHLPRHPKFNTFDQRRSASYGRERLFEVLSQFELWSEMVRACEGSLLEPTDDRREQIKRLRHLGIAYAELGWDNQCQTVLAELESRLPSDTSAGAESERDDAADESKSEANGAESEEQKREREQRRERRRQAKTIHSAMSDIRAHQAIARGDMQLALRELQNVKEDRDELLVARIKSLAGEHADALKAIDELRRTHPNEVIPLAAQIEILWRSGNRDATIAKLEELRGLSGSIQFGTPVFDRVTEIAIELGLPSDWRIPFQVPADFGVRPNLESLGPFRWQPSPAPNWVLHDSSNHPVSLADYSGRPVIVVFFLGNGCLHCAQQLGALAPAYARFQEAGISVVAISSDDAEGLRISLENYEPGFPFPLVSDASLDHFRAYRAYDDFEQQPLHGMYLIDASGRIRWQDISYEPFMDVEFLLAESKRLLNVDTKLHEREHSDILVSTDRVRHTVRRPIADNVAQLALPALAPQGIEGKLILAGPNAPPEVFDEFIAAEAANPSRITLVQIGSADRAENSNQLAEVVARWSRSGNAELRLHRITESNGPTWDATLESIDRAEGVWVFASAADTHASLMQDQLAPKLRQVLARSGTVGIDAPLVGGLAERLAPGIVSTTVAAAACNREPTANTVPTFEKSTALIEQLEFMPQWFGLEIAEHSAVVLQGRLLRAIGGGEVQLRFAPTMFHPAHSVSLNTTDRRADLVALRRFTKGRAESAFPDSDVDLPIVDQGSLVVVGGGRVPSEVLQRFVQLAGGDAASVVIIPVAMPEPLPAENGMAEEFKRLGVKSVTVLTGRTPQDVDQPESLAALRSATGVWFGGGRQWRFVDAYDGTEAEKLLHELVRRGGVIGGSSAGASIQGDYLARGNPLGPESIMADGYERGLRFLSGVAIDQHFTERNRQQDLQSLVSRYPRLLGIGIDESTAIIVHGSVAEVVGDNRVHFYDPSNTTNNTVVPTSLGSNELYDLVARRLIALP